MGERQLCNDLDDVDHWKSNDWIRMALEKRCVSESVPIVLLFIENEVADDIFWRFSHLLYRKWSKRVTFDNYHCNSLHPRVIG